MLEEFAMNKFWALSLLTLAASFTLSCGSGGSGRQLQSITITPAIEGDTVEYTASGTFSTSPTTVTPLAVSWSFAPPDLNYTLTTQPFTFSCSDPQSAGPIVAMAPANPNAPATGSATNTKMVITSGPIPCPNN
jgi:hypothetical protein